MNKSKIKLTVLGCGVMMPTKERNPSGFLLEIENKKILIDAGPGIVRRMVDFEFNPQDIDYVFISHFHTDHFGDVFNMIHSRFVDDLYNEKKHKLLEFWCPKNTKERFKLWRKIFWLEPKENYPIVFKEGARKFKCGKIKVEIFPVIHVKWFDSVGLILKFKDKKIIYTGDIGSDHSFNDLVKKCRNADLLITEASYNIPTPNHYTIQQTKELAKKAKVKKILAVHIRPQHLKDVERVCVEEENFILGIDGMEIEV
jgi:ribonuclease BN (tRNA processing enzyme)